MTNIYSINEEVQVALSLIDKCFDEDGEQIATDEEVNEAYKRLEELQNTKDELITWYLDDRQNRLAEVKAIEEEKKRLIEIFDYKIKTQNKIIERRTKAIDLHFQDIDKKVLFGNYAISYTKSTSTQINTEMIPEKYKERDTIEIVKTPKDKIRKDLQAGIEIPGAMLIEKKTLKIK